MDNTFTDKRGRVWTLEITTGLLKPLREAGLNAVLADADPKAVGDVAGDPETFARVLWTLVEEQAAELKVGPEEFARSLNGSALAGAGDALGVALSDFFLRRPGAAMKMRARMGAATAAMSERMERIIEGLDLTPSATGSGSAGNSPGSADSTPGP